MLLETLRRDWTKAHPGGNVWIAGRGGQLFDGGRQTGKFSVTYTDGGKCYTYAEASVYKLAERLGMIPGGDIDYTADAIRAIEAMRAGKSYRSLGGLHDTIRYLNGGGHLVCGQDERDEYDRIVYVFERIEPL